MEEKRYCPECCTETMQGACALFPDEVDSPLVWVCSACNEEVDIKNERKQALLPLGKLYASFYK